LNLNGALVIPMIDICLVNHHTNNNLFVIINGTGIIHQLPKGNISWKSVVTVLDILMATIFDLKKEHFLNILR